jgi:hypothetical protein
MRSVKDVHREGINPLHTSVPLECCMLPSLEHLNPVDEPETYNSLFLPNFSPIRNFSYIKLSGSEEQS